MIGEYVFGKITDYGIEKFEEWRNEDKAQRILLKCFKECYEKNNEIICVDKNIIMSVDRDDIQPNYRPEEIIKNIRGVCEKCILTDDPEERKAIEIEIAYNYLKEANKDLLKLCHIDKDIHSVQDAVLENTEMLKNHHDEMSKGMKEIRNVLRNKDTLPLLYFVEELSNSRMYCYVILKVNTEVEEYLMEEIEEEAGIPAEYRSYMSDGLYCVDVNFLEPVCQVDLRDYLKVLDKAFSENGIGIFGILTHQ